MRSHERVLGRPPLHVRQAQGVTEAEFWELQKSFVAGVFRSEDAKEGPRAFAEKRAPVWSGR